MVYGPVDGKMTELEYDCRNRLIKAGDITYEYDAEGNRIATNTPEYREEYVYDTVSNLPQVLVIKRYDVNSNAEEKEYKDEVSSNIICYYGNGLLYEDNDKGTYYHHYNNIGSTIFLTNSSGKIVEEYSYGELLSGDTSKTKYLYNGQYGIQTEINGLLYMRTRYYNPEVKRFINQDIVLGSITNSQSLNRYAYVQENPISSIDPFGMTPENVATSLGHAALDVLGMVPGVGFLFDAANCAWYIRDGEYAMSAGKAWVGDNYNIIKDGAGNVLAYSSADGMRAFRIQYKPKEGMWRANFQENIMVNNPYPNPEQHSSQLKNVHIDILD